MSFELQPTLIGDRIELRPLREDDFGALFAVAADPLIWEQHPNHDRWKEEVFREFFRGAMDSRGAFLAVDRADGRVIGSSRYHGYDEAKSEIEIGWTFLARSHWGGVYNGEMKRLMLEHAFRFVRSVIFVIGPRNIRSQRAVEKIGGTFAGSRVEPDGRESVVYRLVSPEANREFVHSRLIDAPPARVWAAFQDPARLARWWGPDGFRSTIHEFDLRPGGSWNFLLHGPDGGDYPNECVFREVVAPERVSFDHYLGHHFVMYLTFWPEGSKTRVGWRQVFDTAAEHDRIAEFVLVANEQNLDRLEAEVVRGR